MTFEILCPQGHVLSAEEGHVGYTCECPECGTQFEIPPPPGAEMPAPTAPRDFFGALDQTEDRGSSPLDVVGTTARKPGIVHIPCPNGHALETPVEMLGQDVICPHCQAQFRLRREDSVEYQREQNRLDEIRGRKWLNGAIFAAFGVALLLLFLFVVSRHLK